jgi:hypothetical protein
MGAFITPDWELWEVLLDFSELKGAHTGDNMGNSVYKTLHELEILPQVCYFNTVMVDTERFSIQFLTFTGNNASNNKTLIAKLTSMLNLEHTIHAKLDTVDPD